MCSTPKSTGVFSTRSNGLCCRRQERTWGRAAQAPKCLKGSYTSRRRFALRARGGAIPGACETTISKPNLLGLGSSRRDLAIRLGAVARGVYW